VLRGCDKRRSFQGGTSLLPTAVPQTGCANPAPQGTSYTQRPICTPSLQPHEVEGDPCAPGQAFKPLACPPASSTPLPKGFALAGSFRGPSSAQQSAPLPPQRGQERAEVPRRARTALGGCPSRARPPRRAQLCPACGTRTPHPSQHPRSGEDAMARGG